MSTSNETMYKWVSDARVTGTQQKPVLHVRGTTYRGTGVEGVDATTALRPLLVEMARDPELRRIMLESLLEADASIVEERQAARANYDADRGLLQDWLDELEPDELYMVLHRHELGEVSYRWWTYGEVDDPNGAYARAIGKLPKGMGPRRLGDLVRRYRSSVETLMSED